MFTCCRAPTAATGRWVSRMIHVGAGGEDAGDLERKIKELLGE